MEHKSGPSEGRTVLLAVAAPAEASAVLEAVTKGAPPPLVDWTLLPLAAGFDLVVTGIGKANAAGAVARVLDPARHRCVVSVGVAGALPQGNGLNLDIGEVIAASECVFADEGVQVPDSYVDCAQLGFPLGPAPVVGCAIPVPDGVRGLLRAATGTFYRIATVSTCSGTDALAQQIADRTGAAAEAMEGAAVALAAARLGVPAGELRAISNTTGDRPRQVWNLRRALDALSAAVARLIGSLAHA